MKWRKGVRRALLYGKLTLAVMRGKASRDLRYVEKGIRNAVWCTLRSYRCAVEIVDLLYITVLAATYALAMCYVWMSFFR